MADYPDNLSSPNFPVALRGMLCRLHGKDLTVKARRYDLHETPEELLAARSMDRSSNALATRRVSDMPKATSTNDCAVYVIEPESGIAAKLGVSNNPLSRLLQLQVASHEQLKIRSLFWMPERQAFGIERVSLRVIAKMGRRLTGEWCDMSAPDLAATVACVIKSNEAVQVSDSEMELRNIDALYAQDDEQQYSLALQRGQNPESLLMKKEG